MEYITDTRIKSHLSIYGFNPSNSQCHAIRDYISLLLRWNKAVSLTTVTPVDQIIQFHFGESLFALHTVPIKNGRLADVGSGAGFPGLALKIGCPQLRLTLLEPNQKKAAFLREVARDLQLEDVELVRTRFEHLSPEVGQFDHVTARALGSYEALVRFAESTLVHSGYLILWIGEEDAITIKSMPALQWRDSVLIPGSRRRFLLVGSKK